MFGVNLQIISIKSSRYVMLNSLFKLSKDLVKEFCSVNPHIIKQS